LKLVSVKLVQEKNMKLALNLLIAVMVLSGFEALADKKVEANGTLARDVVRALQLAGVKDSGEVIDGVPYTVDFLNCSYGMAEVTMIDPVCYISLRNGSKEPHLPKRLASLRPTARLIRALEAAGAHSVFNKLAIRFELSVLSLQAILREPIAGSNLTFVDQKQ
jgi:hypothetical protein